jgi:hypothetical protein
MDDLASIGVTSSGSSRGGGSSVTSRNEETRRRREQRQLRQKERVLRESNELRRRAEYLEAGIRIREQQIASLARSNALLTAQCSHANALIAEKDTELGRLGEAMLRQTYAPAQPSHDEEMRLKRQGMEMAHMQRSRGSAAAALSSSVSSSSLSSSASSSAATGQSGVGAAGGPSHGMRNASGVTTGVDAQIDEMTRSVLGAILGGGSSGGGGDGGGAGNHFDGRVAIGPVLGIVAECTRLCEEVSRTPSNPKVPMQEYWIAVANEAMRLNADQRHQIAQLASVHTAKLNELHVFRSGLLDAIRAVTRVRQVPGRQHNNHFGLPGGAANNVHSSYAGLAGLTDPNHHDGHHHGGGGGGMHGGMHGGGQDASAIAVAAEMSFETALSCAQVLPQLARNLEADRTQRRIFHRAFLRVVTPMQAVQLLMMCFGVQ